MSGNGDNAYKHELRALQIELVNLQRKLIESEARILVIVESRDGVGKDGTIKRLTEHMSPRDTRVFAPRVPSDREKTEWYFQRFVPALPAGGEFVVFNRSWYNRAGVERVMGFCTEAEVETFFATVNDFETLLVRSGLSLRKYYLDISRAEQKKRLADRQKDPLKTWKTSPVDAAALKKWNAYTKARDEMFARSSHPHGPWHIVRADHKKTARLELIRDLLAHCHYPGKRKKFIAPDRAIVFPWSPEIAHDGFLAR
ncbi:MAG: polyphosphate kinase 2 [Alphaproteobacteria bacterium]|nr:polyphosphate kinase 2 [Alphaproteobacteria bacterium]